MSELLANSANGTNPPQPDAGDSARSARTARFALSGNSSLAINLLHLFVLSSFAFSQVLYDHISREPGLVTKYVHNMRELLVLVVVISFVLPLILSLFEVLMGVFGKSARETTHILLILLLSFVLILPVLNRFTTTWRASNVFVLALLLGAALTWAYGTFPRIRSVLTVAAPAVIFFPAAFLWNSPATRMLAILSSGATAAGKPIPVVMVVFDEFCGESIKQADQQIDASRYPNFAKLAATSNWYRNATSVNAETAQAVPAILTGRRVKPRILPLLSEHPYNLLDLMIRSRTHEAVIFEPYTHLAPEPRERMEETNSILLPTYYLLRPMGLVFLHQLCPLEERGELPEIPRDWFGLSRLEDVNRLQRTRVIRWPWTSNREEQFDHFLNCIREHRPVDAATAEAEPGARPQFLFMHAVLPHIPLQYLPSGRHYQDDVELTTMTTKAGAGLTETAWRNDELAVARAHERYLLQIGYVDHFIGLLEARLRQMGLYDECLLIVAADHGTSFRPKEMRREPHGDNVAELMSIPLFIKFPGQKTGKISDRNVESIDVLPTLAQVLDLPLPIPAEGQSVLDESVPERPEKVMTHGARYIVPAAFPGKQTAFEVMQRRFGSGNGWEGVYALGLHLELVGRPVSELSVSAAPANLERFNKEVHRTESSTEPRGRVPSLFAGWAVPNNPSEFPVTLAIAVNGVVRGVTRTYDFREEGTPESFDDRTRWEFMVPESAFQPGQNQIDYYRVRGTGSQLTLHPIRN